MKVLIVSCLLCVLGAAFGRPGEFNLPHFDENKLSDQFRRYELPDSINCADEVDTCLREVHQIVRTCLNKWKEQSGPRYEHCSNNDPVVVKAAKEWQVPSHKWHKAIDECLAGKQAPSQEALESLAIQNAATYFYSRKKRNVAATEEVTACWRDARNKKDQCKQKAIQCTKFAHCFGEGPEPTNESLKRWYDYVKRMRNETKEKSKIHVMHMGHCLRNEPHTSGDHGGHHGMH